MQHFPYFNTVHNQLIRLYRPTVNSVWIWTVARNIEYYEYFSFLLTCPITFGSLNLGGSMYVNPHMVNQIWMQNESDDCFISTVCLLEYRAKNRSVSKYLRTILLTL